MPPIVVPPSYAAAIASWRSAFARASLMPPAGVLYGGSSPVPIILGPSPRAGFLSEVRPPPPPPFDPGNYPGLQADWNAINSSVKVLDPTLVDYVVNASGPATSYIAIGAVEYQATAWPTDSSPAAVFGAADGVLACALGLGGASDYDTFHVVSLDSAVPIADQQSLGYNGKWSDGDQFGATLVGSFIDGFAYRQGPGNVGALPPPVAGPQVWCISRRGANYELYRNGVLQLAGAEAATNDTAIQVGGETVDFLTADPGWTMHGKWKRTLAYEGAAFGAPDRAAVTAALLALYT